MGLGYSSVEFQFLETLEIAQKKYYAARIGMELGSNLRHGLVLQVWSRAAMNYWCRGAIDGPILTIIWGGTRLQLLT